MIKLRKAQERGHANHGWLDTYHTFSFANYYDPNYMGFRSLRVINEDRVSPGKGFGTHGHRDMEIITYVLEGALEHKDNIGNGSVIYPGDVQRMSAGTGILHSEFNHSQSESVHLLQIWLLPKTTGISPSYEQHNFGLAKNPGQLRLIAAPDGRDGAVTVHQDVNLYAAILLKGDRISHSLQPQRHAWVQVARGAVTLNGLSLEQGHGAAISDETDLAIAATEDAEILLFDLP
ncbi:MULTISPECIES: pirin family protein [unclassified Coleofasciculus]|uniref:pirin family protein n=1 Tax=unclassified Coleofasciculus TaxID=2692782 RepID=UPI001882BE13|nr:MULTISPECIES: pirin family protein [unclassified Coleofasciculus]MBE9125938.1 pirin family protein [Coleofasciculus sp. LEGE 07081]MBE9149310.1 pirin family protein [Coleofasciculus sp. LEGE 07092]